MKRLIVVAGVLAVVAVLIAVRIMSQGQEAPAKGIEEIQADRGVPVDAVTAREDTLVITREITGEVSGRRQSTLTASMDRKIERVFVREREQVVPGQRLVRYDTRTSPDMVARLEQARERYANAERQVERLEPLFEKGAISESELDRARTELAVAAANLRDARLEVEIVSPIHGIVTLLPVRPGDSVEAGDLVAQVAALDTVRVSAEVSADRAREISEGDPVRPTAGAAGRTAPLPAGRITRVALGADPRDRLYDVEAQLLNPDWSLRPGQLAELSVVVRAIPAAVVAPRAAVLGDEGAVPGAESRLYVVEGMRAQQRTVQLGAVGDDFVEVAAGLSPGDTIVVFGANRLQPGARVSLHELDGAEVAAHSTGAKSGGSGE
ncbi:MAG: efflux RND transporter periplasmic adaptor subunit [Candidatus Eisenbacteria bacterium]|nr:efflux RND transporter periplasmic adaptor subunit [Candidatus Eisenbacteria bacterium]